ncbi:unnamed protein product [Vitrella brassicaformis CCMP3155]|uniref:CCHC-type domain-containing protein n=2 Tax=Vitrella brassicaformis TaxID=1169539 RepID=A0A0G4GV61_VITBC|nr:unnamed protein product [Vitrella brassicaformis CCMP3155]|eukprot:CEM34783.1 unnamed protein product [Vitrella brassicaformis CCMP3155]
MSEEAVTHKKKAKPQRLTDSAEPPTKKQKRTPPPEAHDNEPAPAKRKKLSLAARDGHAPAGRAAPVGVPLRKRRRAAGADGGGGDLPRPRPRVGVWGVDEIEDRMAAIRKQLEKAEDMTKSKRTRLYHRLGKLKTAKGGHGVVGGDVASPDPEKRAAKLLFRKTKRLERRKTLEVSKGAGGAKGRGRAVGKADNSRGAIGKSGEKVCFRCRQSGHRLQDCPLLKAGEASTDAKKATPSSWSSGGSLKGSMCFNCGATDHTLKACTEPRPTDGSLPYAECFICGSKGHLASSCSQNLMGVYPRGGGCHLCGSIYHLQKDCPQKAATAGNRRRAAKGGF